MNEVKTIDGYIAGFPEPIQTLLRDVYRTIKEVVPEAEEAISYGMPTFRIKGKNLLHFAAFKNHIGLYPTPNGIEQFQKELSAYKGAKGSVQFPLDQPLPLDLIKRIAGYRLQKEKENAAKK